MTPTQWRCVALVFVLLLAIGALASGVVTFDQLKEVVPWIVGQFGQ